MSAFGRTLQDLSLPAALAALSPDASVLVLDADLRIVSLEGDMLPREDWTPARVVGKRLSELVPRRAFTTLAQGYKPVLAGEPTSFEYTALGDGVPYRISTFPLHDGDGSVVGGVAVVRSLAARAPDRAIEDARRRFDAVFDRAPVGMALLLPEGDLVRVNPALCALLHCTEEELMMRGYADLMPPDEVRAATRGARRVVSGEIEEHRAERRLRAPGGGVVETLEHVTLVPGEDGHPRLLVTLEDLSDRRQLQDRLQEVFDQDPMTGLPNRPRFERELARRVDRGRWGGDRAAVLMLDLDHFKLVNDAHGYRVGDAVLRHVVGVVRRALPRGTLLARLGGDELGALVDGVDTAGAQAVAGRLVAAVRTEPTAVGDELLHTTASVGVVPLDEEVEDPDATLVAAELAMHEAKASGGDRSVLHDPDAGGREQASHGLRWSQRIRASLELDRLELHAQPIFDVVTGRPDRYELLIRLRDESGTLVPPAHFLPHAERFGLVGGIDRWVVARAVELVAEHAVTLSVNLSGRSIGDPGLPALVEGLVEEAGIDPRRLEFEVTETAAIANMGRAQRLAERLRRLGCSFALDDFGTGFASFAYVKQLPFDVLKIDGSFVRDVATSEGDRLVVGALVDVARGLGKRTVAEFVCDGAVLAEVRACGVDLVQGYHLGAPAPLAAWVAG